MPRGPRNGHRWRELCKQVKREEDHCWLCGYPVDMTLPGTHPAGPSVDHVIPLTRGGALLDRDNARLAHLGCNSGRGNRRPTRRRWSGPSPSVTQRRW